MTQERICLENISIILHKPHFSENIGSTARAMQNMGIRHLIVVSPHECDLSKVLKLATHASIDVIEDMEIFDHLPEALASFQYVVGTTARLGGERPSYSTPEQMAESLVSISKNNRIAIVFGPEDKGLENQDIKLCQMVVTIPTSGFSSLNVSQAVMIICYELFLASSNETDQFTPRLASHHELEAMYDHLHNALNLIGFIHQEKPEHWLMNIRRFFSRLQLRGREVKIIRGICRQVEWFSKQKPVS